MLCFFRNRKLGTNRPVRRQPVALDRPGTPAGGGGGRRSAVREADVVESGTVTKMPYSGEFGSQRAVSGRLGRRS